MSTGRDERIFVSIAAYRDPDLANTVADCLAKAAQPHRVRLGICHQFDGVTAGILDPWAADPRFWVDEVVHTRSRGVGWSRARAQRGYDDEGYYLQVDAHTRFADGWDDRHVGMLDGLDAERPILTSYPHAFRPRADGAVEHHGPTYVRRLGLEPSRPPGSLRQRAEPVDDDATGPGRHPFVAAGHLFTIGRFVRDVPYDPAIYFTGEEISLAVRAYTHGYDLFWPDENLVWHWYDHGGPLHWDDHHDHGALQAATDRRVTRLLAGDDVGMGRYGLGRLRTAAQYQRLAGVPLPPREVAESARGMGARRDPVR